MLYQHLFQPMLIPVTLASSLMSLCITKLREKYIRLYYSKNKILEEILTDYQTLADKNKLSFPKSLQIRVIDNLQESIISTLFETFSSRKSIFSYFNTILVKKDFLDNSDVNEVKLQLYDHITAAAHAQPKINYFLDKALNFILITSLVVTKHFLVTSSAPLFNILLAFTIGSTIQYCIERVANAYMTNKNRQISKQIWSLSDQSSGSEKDNQPSVITPQTSVQLSLMKHYSGSRADLASINESVARRTTIKDELTTSSRSRKC